MDSEVSTSRFSTRLVDRSFTEMLSLNGGEPCSMIDPSAIEAPVAVLRAKGSPRHMPTLFLFLNAADGLLKTSCSKISR